MKIAIISPNQNAYSETFIQAHRNIDANVFYYYGGRIPQYLEGAGFIGCKNDLISRVTRFAYRLLFRPTLSNDELAFKRSLKKNKIDAVLAEYGPTGVAVLNACKAVGIPLVTIFHGVDASKSDVIERHLVQYQELFNYSKKIIAVSALMKKSLIDMGCPEGKIIHTPCAPNDLFLSLNPKFSEPKSFVAIGRFVNKKAPYYTILAFKKVVEKYPDVKLYFAGDGELLEVCKNIVSYFKLEKNIILLGIISPKEYANLLTKVLGFVQHSIKAEDGNMEGTPVSVLEASAAGIPVIATEHAGIPDVIINNETGLLVKEHDVDGMAEKIIYLIDNTNVAKAMGKKGKQRIKENFNMDKHLKLIRHAISY